MATSALQNPEDVLNASLTQIGYKKRIANIYDGSDAANLALNIYSQTVDEQLRAFPWGFSERNVTLTLQKTAPVGGYLPPSAWSTAYPPMPWIYQYALPDNYLYVRSLRQGYGIIPDYAPVAINWRIYNDNSFTPPQTVILTNLASAVLVYTAQVHAPLQWEPLFTEGLIAALAKRLSAALANLNEQQFQGREEAVETKTAAMRVG